MSWWFPGCCPNCIKCRSAPTEWVADFGAGGWTNVQCSECVTYSGEITLDSSGITGVPSPFCVYGAMGCQVDNVCCVWRGPLNPSSNCSYCTYSDGGPVLVLRSLGATWEYMLWVWITQNGDTTRSKVVYSSTPSSSQNCLVDADPGTGKITLSKDSEVHTGLECAGALPSTVDIWVAP